MTSKKNLYPRIRIIAVPTLTSCSYAFGTGLLQEFKDKSHCLKCCKTGLMNYSCGNVEDESADGMKLMRDEDSPED